MSARLLFLAPGDVGKARVEPISWMRTCAAFAGHGCDVELVTLAIRRPDGTDPRRPWEHFAVPQTFRLRVFPTTLTHRSSVGAFRAWAAVAATASTAHSLVRQSVRPRRLVVYSRSPVMLAPFIAARRLLPAAIRPQLVFETHALPNRLGARVAVRADHCVVTSRRLQADVTERLGVPRARVVLAPLGPFNPIVPAPRDAARQAVGLSGEDRVAVYSGKLVEDQNRFLLEAARHVRDRVDRFRLVLVGGNPEILEWTRRQAADLGLGDTVLLPGFVEPARVHLYQAAADVLVFHMSDRLTHWEYCTPAKAFEYMAARRPIVATDLPRFDEVFGADGERAVRVRRRTPEALADGVAGLLGDGDDTGAMVERAAAFVAGRTWEARTRTVLDALAA